VCGIVGALGPKIDSEQLRRMAGKIVHRGPDDDGFFHSLGVGLGMRRLSILDIAGGKQPVFNRDRTITAVFNGEIYNHHELRRDLESKGHAFHSHHSDSELLPALYEEYGDKFLPRLNGMFAIALYDSKTSRLLARDHVGIKPLFYQLNPAAGIEFAFASEIKSILSLPGQRKEPNHRGLYHYFNLKNVPAPETAYKGILHLPPGGMLEFQNGKARISTWWKPHMVEQKVDFQEAVLQLRSLLEDSIKLQMAADVPSGSYLSGGIDSSFVSAVFARNSSARLKTFTLAYEDDLHSKNRDRYFAQWVSKIYDTDHHEYVMTNAEVTGGLDAILQSFDEPFSGTISTFFLTKLIAKHVKVALSGDGADELFGSYLSHRTARPLELFAKSDGDFSRLTSDERLQLGAYFLDPSFLAKTVSAGDPACQRVAMLVGDDAHTSKLLTPEFIAASDNPSTLGLIRALLAGYQGTDALNRMLYLDLVSLLPDQILPFVDRLSMAHSVEVRPPFLDHRIVEFACTLPGHFKIHNGRVKHILKEVVAPYLPEELVNRPKEGFVLPTNTWLRTSLRGLMEETLSERSLAAHGFFNPAYVADLLKRHRAGDFSSENKIWNLMMFQVWWKNSFGS